MGTGPAVPPGGGVLVVGHSFGGLVARAAFLLRNHLPGSIPLLISLGTPHKRSVKQRSAT